MKFNTYKCKVIDRNGKKITIEKQAESEQEVIKSFQGSEYIPIDIQLKKKSLKNKNKNQKSVLEFTQIMEQLLKSGLSLKDSLEVVSIIDSKNKGASNIASLLLSQVEKGISFADAVENYSDIFPPIYTGIIKVGNRIGNVENIFPRLRLYLESTKKIKDKFSSALIYPLMVLFTALLGGFAISLFVFPKLQVMFHELGGESANLLNKNISKLKISMIIILISISALTFLFVIITSLSRKKHSVKLFMDSYLIKIPFLSKIIKYWNTMNFAFAMETLTSGGVSIESAILESRNVVTNLIYKDALEKVSCDLQKGCSLSLAFSKHSVFPDYIYKWLIVGEKSGKTDTVFLQIRNYFQETVEKIIQRFMSLIEPALIIIIGIVILVFVITIVVPLFSIYGGIL